METTANRTSNRKKACDACKKRKTRCVPLPNSEILCKFCGEHSQECTFTDNSTKERLTSRQYIAFLEEKVERLEALLAQSRSEGVTLPADHEPETEKTLDTNLAVESLARYVRSLAIERDIDEGSTDDEQDARPPDPSSSYQSHKSFFGESSDTTFLREALAIRTPSNPSVSHWGHVHDTPMPWEVETFDIKFEFPDEDLLFSLVNLYFEKENVYWPLFHRPSILQAIAQQKHHHDRAFAEHVLLMCALGARYSPDPRVVNPNHPSSLAVGWQWFHRAMNNPWSLVGSVLLSDVQACCLASLFLLESTAPHTAWMVAGTAIRIAQDAGAHRRHTFRHKTAFERESWKRAFYIAASIDRKLSAVLGRTPAIFEEAYDVELPLVCSDEALEREDPSTAALPLLDKSTRSVLFLRTYLQLDQILSTMLCNVYIISKTRFALKRAGMVKHQSLFEGLVRELDSCLNSWFGKIPAIFRWNAAEDEITSNQSIQLYTFYYYVTILLHRPFIFYASRSQPWDIPSLLVSVNAARSCAAMSYEHWERFGTTLPNLAMMVWTAGTLLVLAMWMDKEANSSSYHKDLRKCLVVLQAYKTGNSQRYFDILSRLLEVNRYPHDTLETSATTAQPIYGSNTLEPSATLFPVPGVAPDPVLINDFLAVDPILFTSLFSVDQFQPPDLSWLKSPDIPFTVPSYM